MPTLEQVRLQLENTLADLRAMEIERVAAPAFQPKFKVGDRVKSNFGIGTIESLAPDETERDSGYQIKFDNGNYGHVYESGLEPAPWSLSRHLPGFRDLAEGEEWHRNDFTELAGGWRPLLRGERVYRESDQKLDGCWRAADSADGADSYMVQLRTLRPLPALPTERMALEASDIPPGSVIRGKGWLENQWGANWVAVIETTPSGVRCNRHAICIGWKLLMEDWEILRPGKTEWEPCSKEASRS